MYICLFVNCLGAGSFGHFHAKQFRISAGASSESGAPTILGEQISQYLQEGIARTRLSVTTLNNHILTTLVQKRLPAVGVSPFAMVPANGKAVAPRMVTWPWDSSFSSGLHEALNRGLIPVLHGDVSMDVGDKRVGILSGDTLFVYLCEVFKPAYAVFLTDVPGVLTAPPGTISASGHPPELIPTIEVDSSGNWNCSGIRMSVREHDVTGGIAGKIAAAVQVTSKLKIPVYIVQAGTVDAETAMKGIRPVRGTTIMFVDRQFNNSRHPVPLINANTQLNANNNNAVIRPSHTNRQQPPKAQASAYSYPSSNQVNLGPMAVVGA